MFCECGTGSFKHVDGNAEDLGCGDGSPRGIRRKHGGGGKVNPYAGRGLDRFSVVLSELETRRARILRRVRSDETGLVLVRFAVQSNGGWTPVVVKLPEQPLKQKQGATAKKPRAAASAPPLPPAPASPVTLLDPAGSPREREGVKKTTAKVPERRVSFSWGRWVRRPSCYLPAVVVLTLVSLVVFGRVFAICLTSLWWYVLPILGSFYDDGAAGEDARRSGMKRSVEKTTKLVSPPPPHAKKGSSWGVHVHEVVSWPRGHAKGKRG